MAFPTTVVLDNFNRVNEGPPPSSSWVDIVSGLVVSSNAVATSGGGLRSSYWNTILSAADCEVYAAIASNPANNRSQYVYARLVDIGSGTTDGYALKFNKKSGTDTLQIIRVDNGSETVLGADFSQDLAVGDAFGLEIVGSTLTAYVDTGGGWVSLGSRTDGTHAAAGYVGLGIASGTMDDFGGGSISTAIDLTAVDGGHGHVADVVVAGLVAAAVDVAHELVGETAVLTVDLMAADGGHAQVADAVVAGLVGTAVDGAHELVGETAVLAVDLMAADGGHGHVVDTPSLDSSLTLTVQGGSHDHEAETGALVAVGSADDGLHAHMADEPTVSSSVSLMVAGAAHVHVADSVSAVVALAAVDAAHGFVGETAVFVVGLMAVDGGHAHVVDAPEMVVALVAVDGLHSHVVDAVGLVDLAVGDVTLAGTFEIGVDLVGSFDSGLDLVGEWETAVSLLGEF